MGHGEDGDLGDGFLKYSTTSTKSMADNYDEGNLSTARSKIVGNLNLFHIAESQEKIWRS